MTLIAKELVSQRVAATLRLVIQLHVALLAAKALNVKVLFHRAHPNSFVRPLGWYDHLLAFGTLRRILFVIVLYTVDVILDVQRKGQPVQAIIAIVASEATWMVRFTFIQN